MKRSTPPEPTPPPEKGGAPRSLSDCLLAGVLVYAWVVPGVWNSVTVGSSVTAALGILAEIVLVLLAAWPVLLARRQFGPWNPVTVSALVPAAFQIAGEPLRFLDGLLQDPVLREPMFTTDTPPQDVRLLLLGLTVVASWCVYIGFRRGPRPRVVIPERFRTDVPLVVAVAAVTLSVLACAAIIYRSGGLTEHFGNLALGRRRALGDLGPLVLLTAVGSTALVLRLASAPKDRRNPFFWILVTVSLSVVFLTSGSRSSIAISGVMLIIVCWWHAGPRVLITAAPIFLVGYGLFGLLGLARRDVQAFEAAISSEEFSFVSLLTDTAEEGRTRRSADMNGQVVDNWWTGQPGLDGRTYVGAVFTFVPRAIWPDKPRGAGAYAGQVLLMGSDANEPGFTTGAMPISPLAESLWTFGFGGVVLLHLLYGWIVRAVYELFRPNWHRLTVRLVYVVFALQFVGPGSDVLVRGITNTVQFSALLIASLGAAAVLRAFGAGREDRAPAALPPMVS